MKTSYQYSSLHGLPENTIRLLTLFPGSEEDELVCDLSSASLSDQPTYAALSYTWGEADDTYAIRLDNKTFRIRKNLWQCLKRLRHQSFHIRLWIDAICVNQADLDERRSQVALMRHIYTGAIIVVSWLGRDVGQNAEFLAAELAQVTKKWFAKSFTTDQRALSVVRALHFEHGTEIAVGSAAPDVSDTPWEQTYLCVSGLALQKMSASVEDRMQVLSVWKGIRELVHRPYWSRLWIVQETLLAKNLLLVFDDDYIPASVLQTLSDTIDRAITRSLGNFARTALDRDIELMKVAREVRGGFARTILHNLAENVPHRLSMKELIYLCGRQKCADARDMVYGLLSIAYDSEGIDADYTRSSSDLFWFLLTRYRQIESFYVRELGRVLAVTQVPLLANPRKRSLAEMGWLSFRPYADVYGLLFRRAIHQELSDTTTELQHQAFVWLQVPVGHGVSEDLEEAGVRRDSPFREQCIVPAIGFVVCYTPITKGDLLFRVLEASVYIVCRQRDDAFDVIGRAYPDFVIHTESEIGSGNFEERTISGMPRIPPTLPRPGTSFAGYNPSVVKPIEALDKYVDCKLPATPSLITDMVNNLTDDLRFPRDTDPIIPPD